MYAPRERDIAVAHGFRFTVNTGAKFATCTFPPLCPDFRVNHTVENSGVFLAIIVERRCTRTVETLSLPYNTIIK